MEAFGFEVASHSRLPRIHLQRTIALVFAQWHDDGDWWHGDERHNDGKGQKAAAPPLPPAYQPQHHREHIYKSRQLGLI